MLHETIRLPTLCRQAATKRRNYSSWDSIKMSLGGQLVAKLSRSNENLYSPENGRNNNEFKKKQYK